MAVFSPGPHKVEGMKERSGLPFIRRLIPFLKAPPSGRNLLPKGSPPNAIALRIGLQCMNSGGTQTLVFRMGKEEKENLETMEVQAESTMQLVIAA